MKKIDEAEADKVKAGWDYKPGPDHWDEAVRPSGMPRHHWRQLAVSLGHLGPTQLTRRWQIGQQLIQANGVTYNVYGDPKGKERPWSLDPIPLVMDPVEWPGLEKAIIQRATLLNHILIDLYGEQRLIHQRLLPAALVYANPNFLRPCGGIRPPKDVFLHNYAVDLARSPDGHWWAISDRTQAPSGMGYALENRLVSARMLSSIFNQCRVLPLNRFFDQFRDGLLDLAANHRDNPRVVLLTPGPNNETYFEQSLLARHWGFPLVEGADLTVRENRVFLKTLAGLEPVDLVLRRMDDSFCDPLELRGDSLLGIPGFTQALRSQNVAVANALGTGLLETAAFTPFLPSLCRHLLGEELLLPSVAAWWCGQEGPRRFVQEHLEDLVIRPAFRRPGLNPEFPAYMDAAARAELIQRIEADPEQYVAQEQVTLSTAPVRTDTGFQPRHVVLRAFAVADGASYSVMPGGLTRVSIEASSPLVAMQLGSGSKDTWLLGGDEDSASQAVPQRREATPGAPGIPSRVADNVFWLGRYLERVESGVRMVTALLPALSGEEDFGQNASLDTAMQLLISLGYLTEEMQTASLGQQHRQLNHLLSAMVYDPSQGSGIGWNLKNLRRVAWPVKERLSQDTWRVLQQMEAEFSAAPPADLELRLVAEMSLLERVVLILSAFSGLLMENTTRSLDWLFLDIGRRLERALQLAELLQASMVRDESEQERSLATLLQIADSSITYRTRYLTELNIENVLDLLLRDRINPRSISFQLATLVGHLQHLPGNEFSSPGPQPNALAENLLQRLQNADLQDLAARDEDGNLPALAELIRQLKGTLYDVSELLSAQYFSHLTVSRLTPSL